MASAPCSRVPCAFGSDSPNDDYWPSRGSGSLNGDYLPQRLSTPSLLADCAAPIHPFEGNGFHELDSLSSDGTSSSLLCSPRLLDRHVFLCFKEPRSWPSVVEAADSDRLPRFLAAAIMTRKSEMMRKTRLIICEGRDGTESSNGDVMIFPDMVRYRGLTHFDVDAFVDEVLVRNREWLPGRPEKLLGTYVFVCAHGNHEIKYGALGPAIIQELKNEVACRGLDGSLSVKPCSYIEGYKYARNLIVYSANGEGEIIGHCYGSVTPDNVPNLLNDFIGKGLLPSEDDRLPLVSESENVQVLHKSPQDGNGVCCMAWNRNHQQPTDPSDGHITIEGEGYQKMRAQKDLRKEHDIRKRVYASSKWWQASWWFSFWEHEDTVAVFAVLGAATSVALTYQLYRSRYGR